MLRKFLSIQNVGRFHSMAATGDVELRDFNLIFGENGRGKTTLCAILRSVQSGEPSHIRGRHTLGSAIPPGVQIMTTRQSGPIQFRDYAWSNTVPELVIYDQTFVSQNVYVGDTVGADQKRNLFKVIVGQAAVRSAEELDLVVRDIRTVSTAIREAQTAVRSHLPTGMKLETFLNASADPEIEAKIATAGADVRAASEVDLLRSRPPLHRLELPAAFEGLQSLLAESLDSLSAGAEQLIRIHLERHGMRGEKAGQAWLAEGMGYRVEEGCPFCGQSVEGLALIGAFRTMFSADYRSLKDRITEVGRQIGAQFGETAAAAVTQTVRENVASHDFWSRFADLPPVDQTPVAAAGSVLRTYGQGLLEILRRKVASPLEPLAPSEELVAASDAYALMRAAAVGYNAQCDAANAVINARRATADGAALPRLQARLLELQALKKRRERPLLELCADLLGKIARKEELEIKRERLKQDLDAQSQRVSAYRDAINRYLDLFNAGFEVAKVDHNYVGGVNASFQISINKVAVAAGDDKTPVDQPSFRNTLSAGDRSTLALAFFLAQLEKDPNAAQRVVVFDDPFNSQDSFRRNQTALEIARVIERCAQVLVLSHDARFLKQLAEKVRGRSIKTLKLSPVGEDTQITDLDLDALLRSEMHIYVDQLQSYHRANTGSSTDIVQKIRPLLEGYCRNVCLTLFTTDDNLAVILAGIRATGDGHPLQGVYAELSDLNDYTRRYHHADGSVSGPIDEAELRGVIRRTLRIVGAII